jgi:hypothetical protein
MPQAPADILRFLVLVPHRDTVKILREYSRLLFKAGFFGAFSFPSVVPLALLSRPCTGEELTELARTLRQAVCAGGREGKFRAGEPGTVPFPDIPGETFLSGCSFFGPVLDLPAPDWSLPGLIPFPVLVLTTALVGGTGPAEEGRAVREPAPPINGFFFRAAAAANMALRPLDNQDSSGLDPYSLEWKIGRLRWLPAMKRKTGESPGGTPF